MALFSIIDHFENNPKKLFLIDGIGAILSAFLLGFVLVKLERMFGLPPSTLYLLASFPVVFAAYDFYCYIFLEKLSILLKVIASLNASYCILSIGFAFYHIKSLTIMGWVYIVVEIIIVLYLAIIEFKVASKLQE